MHPEVRGRISDVFHIDLMNYWGAYIHKSELQEHGEGLKEAVNKLTSEMVKLNSHLNNLSRVSGPTGLDLSISSIRNLRHVIAGESSIVKIDPTGTNYDVFMEVLGVDFHMATRLEHCFWRGSVSGTLMEIEGMTEQLVEKIREHFIVVEILEGNEEG